MRDLFVTVPAYDTLPIFTGKYDSTFTPIGISPNDPVSDQNRNLKPSVPAELPAPLTEKDIPELKKVVFSH